MNQGAGVRFKLSVMMFLEFAIWGAWLPFLYGYLASLNFGPWEIGFTFNAFAIASILAMFFSNQFADRNFAAEKFVAFSHLIGGLAILGLPFVTSFWPFFGLMLLHCIFYVPTISITNSIAFANLKDPQTEFSLVRLWGTIGWIVVGIPFIFLLLDWNSMPVYGSVPFSEWLGAFFGGHEKKGEALREAKSLVFIAAGIASLLLSGLSLLLPHTPPKPTHEAEKKLAWLEAMRLLRHPFILVLFLVTFVDSAVHTGYFIFADRYFVSVGIQENWVMPVMSIGQFAEIGTMAVLGWFLKRLGWRYTMILGVLGHTIRFVLFGLVQEPWVAITVNVLHGVCYAFFFATVYIFVDEFFPKDARSSAQGIFNFLILGVGPLVGYFLWPYLQGEFTANGKVDYRNLFMIPAGAALVAALLLLVFFWPPKSAAAAKPD